MKKPSTNKGPAVIDIILVLFIVALLLTVMTAGFISANKKSEEATAVKKQILGDESKLFLISVGSRGEKIFYYLVPNEEDKRVIKPLNEIKAMPTINAPDHHIIVATSGNKVIKKAKSITLDP